MRQANFGAVRPFATAAVLVLLAAPTFGQVVEKGRTFADLTASHPCTNGLTERIARVIDCDAADDVGDGGGAFQCWVRCDGSAPWETVAIGAGGGGLPGADEVTEAMLKSVNGPTDEYMLTYESTTGDFEWQAPATGDVVGPSSAVDNAFVRFDATTGKIVQSSNLTCSDVSGVTTTISTITPAATTGASVAGQSLAITASPAVASTDTAGAAAGGGITVATGAAARNASGNANGGNFTLNLGAGIGTGRRGNMILTGSPAGSLGSILGTEDTYGFVFHTGGGIGVVMNETARTYFTAGGDINLSVALALKWSSGASADPSYFTGDIGLARSAAGVVKVTNGSTGIRGLLGGGAAVASATALPVPTGRVFHVTGTTTITSITSTNFQSGACVTLIFDDALTFTDGSNLKLAGDFVTTADDSISLCYDGTSWFETSRSMN